MKILISTGIYPPQIGGPAQYAKNLREVLEKKGHKIFLTTFNLERYLPTGVRHLYFFIKIIPRVVLSHGAFIFDTYSIGFPTVLACKIFSRKSVIRTGGDFLWEQYVERTRKKVLLRNFYETEKGNFSRKEKIIFTITRWTLHNTSHVIFSTEWQRDIFIRAYKIDKEKTSIVENFYGPKEQASQGTSKVFIASTRNLVWKNLDMLRKIFGSTRAKHSDIELFTENVSFSVFMKKMKECYAVVLVSLGDISPNMILDAIRNNKPFICTREVGIYERIKDAGMFVDPLNETEIQSALENILTKEGYARAEEKVKTFNFTHTWDEISSEFMNIFSLL